MLFSWGNIRKADLSLQLRFYFGPFIYILSKIKHIILEIVHISPGFFL